MAEQTKLSEIDLELLGDDIAELLDTIYSILDLSRAKRNNDEMSMAGIIALAEKAGFLADRCCAPLGRTPICGTWEEWAELNRPKVEEAQEASAAT